MSKDLGISCEKVHHVKLFSDVDQPHKSHPSTGKSGTDKGDSDRKWLTKVVAAPERGRAFVYFFLPLPTALFLFLSVHVFRNCFMLGWLWLGGGWVGAITSSHLHKSRYATS